MRWAMINKNYISKGIAFICLISFSLLLLHGHYPQMIGNQKINDETFRLKHQPENQQQLEKEDVKEQDAQKGLKRKKFQEEIKPVVKTQSSENKPAKRSKSFIYIIAGLAIAGGITALLLGGKDSDTGSIMVNSSPTGAKVFLDGTDTGQQTNCTLSNISVGTHTIKLSKEGYIDHLKRVTVKSGQSTDLNITLSIHTITIISPTTNTFWAKGTEVTINWESNQTVSNQIFNHLNNTGLRDNLVMSRFRNFPGRYSLRGSRSDIKSEKPMRTRNQKKLLPSAKKGLEYTNPSNQTKNQGEINGKLSNLNPLSPKYYPQSLNASYPVKPQVLTNVKIELFRSDIYVTTVIEKTANDGEFKWTIPSSIETGSNYSIKISCFDEPSVSITSEKFKIGDLIDSFDLVKIPAGWFKMGDNFNEGSISERPVHDVYLDTFYISKYEITFDQYDFFCEDTGRSKPLDNDGWGRGERPVINVSWNDAKAFCDWLSDKTGKNIHLPTEAQWEKAARGTDQRRYPWGNSAPNSNLANYYSNVGKTVPVGSYPAGASPYGLHDMAGNVWELCQDWYDSSYYSTSPSRNPKGPSSGSIRVRRGGNWIFDARYLRSACRLGIYPHIKKNDIGFRICQEK